MDFTVTPEQEAIRTAIAKVCAAFDLEYWLQKDRAGCFPHEFHAALARDGWLGIAMPVEYGGAGLGIVEAAIMTHGGMGYAKEYHVERFFREALIPRIAPISPELILCFIAEKVLGLPRSY